MQPKSPTAVTRLHPLSSAVIFPSANRQPLTATTFHFMIITITSGYFDPMHRGHLELLELSRAQGDVLWVIVNTDAQAALKKGKAFIDQDTRLAVTAALRVVDRAVLSIDADGSVCATLDWLIGEAKAQGHEAVFCKGGDRNAGNIPEMTVLNKHGAKLIDGLGAKIDSSSRIIAGANKPSA
jgi:cytidyltransferase-like protein